MQKDLDDREAIRKEIDIESYPRKVWTCKEKEKNEAEKIEHAKWNIDSDEKQVSKFLVFFGTLF